MSKTESMSKSNSEAKISFCDIFKNDTSRVIQKFELQIPSQFQQYSDLYTTYLHTLDDGYGTCYISEKEFFDNLHIDQGILKSIQEYSKIVTETYLNQIDFYAKFRHEILQTQISSLKVYDDFLHTMMESYANTLSQFNKSVNPSRSK